VGGHGRFALVPVNTTTDVNYAQTSWTYSSFQMRQAAQSLYDSVISIRIGTKAVVSAGLCRWYKRPPARLPMLLPAASVHPAPSEAALPLPPGHCSKVYLQFGRLIEMHVVRCTL
jgi:hypothetical protein